MIDITKVKKIILFYENEEFSFGDHDGMQRAEDIVHIMKMFLKDRDENVLIKSLDGYCPDDYDFRPTEDDCKADCDKCKEHWTELLSIKE